MSSSVTCNYPLSCRCTTQGLQANAPSPHSQLLATPEVLFAGYKVPHPLHPYFILKIQTDGTITPTAVLEKACTKLIGTLASLETQFKREFSYKEVEGAVPEDVYGAPTATWAGARDYMDL